MQNWSRGDYFTNTERFTFFFMQELKYYLWTETWTWNFGEDSRQYSQQLSQRVNNKPKFDKIQAYQIWQAHQKQSPRVVL